MEFKSITNFPASISPSFTKNTPEDNFTVPKWVVPGLEPFHLILEAFVSIAYSTATAEASDAACNSVSSSLELFLQEMAPTITNARIVDLKIIDFINRF